MSASLDCAAMIAADMRNLADDIADGRAIVGQSVWRSYADRVEAVGTGNVAKMREALIRCATLGEYCFQDIHAEVAEVSRAALAAPPRNCDKYTSLDEARNAYMAINEMPEGNRDEDMRRWLCDFHNWLFAIAKGGGAK